MSRPKYSHASSSAISEPVVMSQFGTGRRSLTRSAASAALSAAGACADLGSTTSAMGSGSLRVSRSMHRRALRVQGLPYMIACLGEFRRAAHDAEFGTRARQRHRHDLLHAAFLDHDDAVG